MPMRIPPPHDVTTLVLLGAFSPSVFHPAWFAAQKAIGAQEAAAAEIGVLHPDIASFKTAKVMVEVQSNRFSVSSEILPEAAQDLALTVFGGPLVGTPIFAMGINRSLHFDTGSLAAQHAIGRRLAPIEPWGEWGRSMDDDLHSTTRGGLMSIRMQIFRKEGPPGYVQVRLEPSTIIKGTGIFLDVNCHFSFQSDPPQAADATKMVEVLKSQWSPANTTAEAIADQIMSLVEEETRK
jgi:hypothetical protein